MDFFPTIIHNSNEFLMTTCDFKTKIVFLVSINRGNLLYWVNIPCNCYKQSRSSVCTKNRISSLSAGLSMHRHEIELNLVFVVLFIIFYQSELEIILKSLQDFKQFRKLWYIKLFFLFLTILTKGYSSSSLFTFFLFTDDILVSDVLLSFIWSTKNNLHVLSEWSGLKRRKEKEGSQLKLDFFPRQSPHRTFSYFEHITITLYNFCFIHTVFCYVALKLFSGLKFVYVV